MTHPSALLLQKVRKIIDFHKQGLLRGEIMPEDANPGLAKDSEDALLYFTLPMALNYQRNSYKLWESALKTWHDPETGFVFDPAKVVQTSFATLQSALLKHKVALQPNKHPEIWQKICTSLVDHHKGKITQLLQQQDFDIEKIQTLIVKEKKGFPYLAGPKICNYWLYVLSQYTTHSFKNLQALSVAPDTHVIQASVRLGLVPANSNSLVVADAWKNLLQDTDLSPIHVHTPLWLWSRQDFTPEVA